MFGKPGSLMPTLSAVQRGQVGNQVHARYATVAAPTGFVDLLAQRMNMAAQTFAVGRAIAARRLFEHVPAHHRRAPAHQDLEQLECGRCQGNECFTAVYFECIQIVDQIRYAKPVRNNTAAALEHGLDAGGELVQRKSWACYCFFFRPVQGPTPMPPNAPTCRQASRSAEYRASACRDRWPCTCRRW